jgi:hypothetical protein
VFFEVPVELVARLIADGITDYRNDVEFGAVHGPSILGGKWWAGRRKKIFPRPARSWNDRKCGFSAPFLKGLQFSYMGYLNDEQEVAENGRSNILKDVEAPLRDQIPTKLAEKLEEMDIGEKVVAIWNMGNANRTAWLERQQVYLKDWDEFLVSTADGPFEGSSNLHIPMPLVICKTVHARFMQALMGIDPPFMIKGRTEGQLDRGFLITNLVRYVLLEYCNECDGIEEEVDKWLWDWVSVGSAILKNRWECLYERFVDVEEKMVPGPPVYKTDPQTGQQTMFRLPKKQENEVIRTVKTFEGAIYEKRNMEDVLIVGGAGDPQKADCVIDRSFMTASNIWTLVDRKIFREEKSREVIKGGRDYAMGSVAGGIKLQRAEHGGKAQLQTDAELDRYEILEAYLAVDVDGSGINSQIVVWVHYRTRHILRANYLRRMIKSGERPFFKIDYHKRPDADYGIGLVEQLHPLSVELDAIHNMRLDFGLISTIPFGFYKPTSNIQPETLTIEPGALIPVDNPQTDVYFPNLGNRTAWGFQEEQAIFTLIERLSSVNDLNQAVMTGTQGPTRTATGARALLGESNANLDVYLKRLNRGWKRLLQFTFHQLQQRIPDGFQFRVLGEDGNEYWETVKSKDYIAGDFDFQVCPNSSQSNPQIMEENAQVILQITGNPLDIQLGCITPTNRYEALRNWFRTKSIKEYNRYIQKPPDYVYLPTPEEEANRILRGIEVPVLPNSDHQGFMTYFEYIMSHEEILGQFDQAQTALLKAQAQKHEQMMKALEAARQQQSQISQAQINSRNAFQQTAPGAPPGAGEVQQAPGLLPPAG